MVLGEKSQRNTKFGCAFIQELSRVMREKSHKEHMSDISIAVSFYSILPITCTILCACLHSMCFVTCFEHKRQDSPI